MTDGLWVSGLRTEGRIDPLGIDEASPRLSWRLESDRPATVQAEHRIQVARDRSFRDATLLWDMGEREGGESNAIPYEGRPLASRERVWWRVRVRDNHGRRSGWSEPGSWEMGLLNSSDWVGRWVGQRSAEPGRGVYLRRSFELEERAVRARIYATAVGLYELRLNGRRVGDERLTPGWTDYRRRIQYQTYDVTAALEVGENVLGGILGSGWYAGQVGWFGRGHYGEQLALLCQLEVELADGSVLVVASDESWRAAAGALLGGDLLAGERVDGRLEPIGWDRAGLDDRRWSRAEVRRAPEATLVASRDDGIRVVETIVPTTMSQRGRGRFVADFGQNIAGFVRIAATAEAGTTISIRHAEVLDQAGELYTANLRSAEARDEYTFRGDTIETFEPRFTFHGFRYAELISSDPKLRLERVEARTVSSAGRLIGAFDCDDDLVNAVHRNAVRSLRANFVSIPTDCPQRDERLGWTGDVQVFAPSALFLADVGPLLEKWLIDLADAQLPSGAYPDVAPLVGSVGAGNAGWADAGVLVPWAIYEATGDRRVLERQYDSMRRYMGFLERDHNDGIRDAGLYGDWLSLGLSTRSELVGTAYLARSSAVFVRIARVLGVIPDADRFESLVGAARDAFRDAFVGADGRIEGDTQTGYALALAFGLVPAHLRVPAATRLAGLIEAAGTHLQTGFLGTPVLLHALSDNGFHELACRLARQDTFPSWGFEVAQGATTIWERWNGWTPEEGFGDPSMNSFNHYAFGCLADWLHRHVAGLAPAEPGYRRVVVRPRPSGGFGRAAASHESPHGRHGVEWEMEGGTVRVTVEVPPNTTADVELPGPAEGIAVNGRRVDAASALAIDEIAIGTRVRLGSGSHELVSALAGTAALP